MVDTVFVTGCASGIGAATAELLKQQGKRIIGFDRNKPSENVDEFIKVDLSNNDSIDAAIKQVKSTADAICNIAGVPPTAPPLVQIRVNFLGLKYFTEQLVPKLNDGSSIVNLASLAGFAWEQDLELIREVMNLVGDEELESFLEKNNVGGEAAYGFSKQAVNAWTKMAAQQWASRDITIKSVNPGPIKTPILDDFMKTIVKNQVQLPEEYLGEPRDIAALVCFLASSGAKWINGSHILIDGGLHSFRFNNNEL